MKPRSLIRDTLSAGPMTVAGVASLTGLEVDLVRGELKAMVEADLVQAMPGQAWQLTQHGRARANGGARTSRATEEARFRELMADGDAPTGEVEAAVYEPPVREHDACDPEVVGFSAKGDRALVQACLDTGGLPYALVLPDQRCVWVGPDGKPWREGVPVGAPR